MTADLGSGDEDREDCVLDPTDIECGENGEVYSTTEVLHIEKNGLSSKQHWFDKTFKIR